jgi:2-oxoglutarate ferredoxin oxidoreductase subunit alpha
MSTVPPLQKCNDFVIKFANINGTGSASANELFARAVMGMGVPVAPRNIFPSNIQGLPTWYEMRVSGEGWFGRRGGCDLMVAMNPQTWDRDVAEVAPGGYLLYDDTRRLPRSRWRDDLTLLGLPFTEICLREYTDARQRLLMKNVLYVGALTALLDIEIAVIERLVAR